jgi:hypothetical protein
MITHYSITSEIARQRHEQIATTIAASRRPRPDGRRRWSKRHFRRRSDTAITPAPAPISRTATAA